MIPYFSYEKIDLGIVTLNTWGLMVGLGFALGAWYLLKQAKKNNLDENKILNLILVIFVASFIGARFFYVLQFGREYFISGEFFRIWDGGLMFYGGFIGGLIGAAGYVYLSYPLSVSNNSSLTRGGEMLRTADILAPGVALGLIAGRVGCFLINDHIGAATSLFWAIKFPDGTLRHPVILYLIISNTLLFIMTVILKNKFKQVGALSLFFVLWYSTGRLILDFFRVIDVSGLGDPSVFNLTVSQIVSVVILLVIVAILILQPKPKQSLIINKQ